MKFKVLVLAAASLLAFAPVAAGAAKPTYGAWGYDATAMDRSVKPGDDFFAYVNGAWDKRTPIAEDRTFVGIDSVLNDQIDRDVRSDNEHKNNDPDPNVKHLHQIALFY
jgi:predicted metalloendopeptidase